jgi:maleylacetate reductase
VDDLRAPDHRRDAAGGSVPFRHEPPPGRVRFGPGTLELVPDEVALLGGNRVLLVASASATASAQRLAARLGDRLAATWTRTAQHVPEGLVDAALGRAREVRADVVVSVGGGSATGLAKAVAAGTGLPVVAVPTTYAGSEVTAIYGITGTHKLTRRDPRVQPRVIVYDPELTRDLPARTTVTSGFNALAHCVEALYAPGTDPICALHAAEGIRVLFSALPAVVRDPADLDARGAAMYGAYLAGTALADAGTGAHHTMCHVLGGDYGLVHAEVHTVLLPHVTALRQASPDPVGRVLDNADPAGALADLAARLDAPRGLAEIGMPGDELGVAAKRVCDAVAGASAPAYDLPTIRTLLDDAFHCRRPHTRRASTTRATSIGRPASKGRKQ